MEMEMESSRRSLDRSKEPGLLKKPRLAEAGARDPRVMLGTKDAGGERDRPFLPRGGPAGGGAADLAVSRFRANERERELNQTTSGYWGTSSYQRQQMKELAAQYKTALAELTFNSKPIITNLTIIAGENLHAAKVIAAIVCANILEVPSELKLPSLYLLDSIVKNIGRDYIKYFAAKLPEVFCKAYKQVDSSIHSGMRHLFGTWKGVFPPGPLMIIEKELDFPSMINGSSSGRGSRPDSQAQRPPHSIHVNPKYLEARQQLQQPSRVKGVGSDNVGRAATTIEDVERPGRVPVIGGSRQWTDPSIKNIQQPQRELSNESVHEKNPGPGYGDHDFVSDYSRHLDSGVSRTRGRYTEREISNKPWDSAGRSTRETPLDQRNGSDADHAYRNYISGQTIIQPSSNKPNSPNWKNSEEEEYMWDDVNSRLMDPGSSNTSSWSPDDSERPTSFRRAKRTVTDIEPLESKWNRLDTLSQLDKAAGHEHRVPSFRGTGHIPTAHLQHDSGSRADREPSADSLSTGGPVLGHRTPGLWSSKKMKVSLGGLDHLSPRISSQQEVHPIPGGDEVSISMDVSFPKMGRHFMSPSVGAVSSNVGSLVNPALACSGMIDKKHQLPLRSPSPSADVYASSTLHPQNSHNTADHDHLKPQKPMQFPGQLKQAIPSQVMSDSFSPGLESDIQQSDSLTNPQQLLSKISQSIKMSSVSSTFHQVQHQLPFLQESEFDLPIQQMQREPQPSIHSQEPLHPPLSYGSTEANGSSGLSNSINSDGDVLDQSSASKLLAAIMKSGLISSTSATSLENLIIEPPLPSGPPPNQVLSTPPSSVPFSSALVPIPHGGYTQTPAAHPPVPVLPPLPPGPPPPSSLVGTSPQVTNTANTNPNPLSCLLSSLVAKGLISSTGAKPSDPANTEMPSQLNSQSSILPPCTSMPFTSSASSTVPLPSSSNEPPRAEASTPNGDISSRAITEEVKGLIGLEFKPEVVREFHPLVIDCLYDDLGHQCIKCGLRFKVQEDIRRHFDWHASKSDTSTSDRVSRKWYANSDEWVVSHAETLHGSAHRFLEATVSKPEKCELMVPADENQCICALCGELFEDFYCEQRDEWMYKGTVYINQSAREGNIKHMDKEEVQGLIVHEKCVSRNSSREFEISIDKMEQAGG